MRIRKQYPHLYIYVGWPGRVTGRYGQTCRALVWGGGPGPRNVLVRFDDGTLCVVPARTLRRAREATEAEKTND